MYVLVFFSKDNVSIEHLKRVVIAYDTDERSLWRVSYFSYGKATCHDVRACGLCCCVPILITTFSVNLSGAYSWPQYGCRASVNYVIFVFFFQRQRLYREDLT